MVKGRRDHGRAANQKELNSEYDASAGDKLWVSR